MSRITSCGARVAIAAIGLAAALAAPAAVALTTLRVGKAQEDADNMIPVDVGDKLGFFQQHGLKLEIYNFRGDSKLAQAVAAGAIDIADGAGSEMALVAKGAPMKAVCEDEGTFPFLSIGVPWDSPIHSVTQLQGKRIGISAPGSLTDWLAHQLAQKEGWGPDGVETVAIGSAPSDVIAAFRQHLLDAYIGGTSEFLNMEEEKIGWLLVPVTSFEGDMAAGDIYASDALIKTDPAAIRAFLAAWIETIRTMRAHKAETVKLEGQITGFSPTVMAKEYDITIGMFDETCRFHPQALDLLARSFVDLKLVSARPDMSKLYTEAYLPNR